MSDKKHDLMRAFPKGSKTPITAKTLVLVVDTILSEMLKMQTRVATLEAANATLRKSLDALAQKPSMQFAGVWKPNTTYARGDVTTRSGCGWVCTDAHVARDAFDHGRFQMFTKAGRDGKDLG